MMWEAWVSLVALLLLTAGGAVYVLIWGRAMVADAKRDRNERRAKAQMFINEEIRFLIKDGVASEGVLEQLIREHRAI